MIKKILIIAVILIVGAVAVIYFVPWGEYESELEKTELTNTIEYIEDENVPPSLDELEGLYAISSSKNSAAEIMFLTEGLKDTKGGFERFEISFNIGSDFKESSLNVTIETASLNSGNAMRDEHLAEEDFFNTTKYPQITFVSHSVEMGDSSYIAIGELTLNGATKALEVPFKHLGSGDKNEVLFEAFEGKFTFDRTAYGQEESSGVGNDVTVSFYCELEKQN